MAPRCFEPRLRSSRTIDVGGPWLACSGVKQEQVSLTVDSNNQLYARAPAKEDFEAIMCRYLLTHAAVTPGHPSVPKDLRRSSGTEGYPSLPANRGHAGVCA
eukprot:1187494-Prorocentrum_minimum.AAC.2